MGVEGRGYSFATFDSPNHAERARGRELWVAVLWRHVRDEENKGIWETGEVYHGIIVARVEGQQGKNGKDGKEGEGHVYERLGKIPFADKDLGECEWMSDGRLVEKFTLV